MALDLKEVSKGFSKVFNDALATQNTDYLKLVTEVKANTRVVDYRWIGDIPKMREWVGDRTFNQLTSQKYLIEKKNWEVSIEVDRDDIEYDNIGIVKPRIQAMAQECVEHYNELVFGLLEANDTCFDGKAFFAADHAVGSGTFKNLLALELSQENLLAARAEMRGLCNEFGKPLNIRPNLLVIPPELEVTALKILKADTLANGESNITKGIVDFVVCDRLTDDKAWYLFDTSRVLKPIILQINKRPEFVAQDKPDSESNFLRRTHRYGVDTEDNAGYGLWQLALKSKPTT